MMYSMIVNAAKHDQKIFRYNDTCKVLRNLMNQNPFAKNAATTCISLMATTETAIIHLIQSLGPACLAFSFSLLLNNLRAP